MAHLLDVYNVGIDVSKLRALTSRAGESDYRARREFLKEVQEIRAKEHGPLADLKFIGMEINAFDVHLRAAEGFVRDGKTKEADAQILAASGSLHRAGAAIIILGKQIQNIPKT